MERGSCVLLMCLLCTSCQASIVEDHYFKSVSGDSERATNYFRLRVRANSAFSETRYIAGYYDERAVDLYFNEYKKEDIGVFGSKLVDPGTDQKIVPLTPEEERGTFVMILSTSAKAVADTIGAFAESRVVSDVIGGVAEQQRREDLGKQDIRVKKRMSGAEAAGRQLDSLLLMLDTERDASKAADTLLRCLNVVCIELGATASFSTVKEARQFLGSIGVD